MVSSCEVGSRILASPGLQGPGSQHTWCLPGGGSLLGRSVGGGVGVRKRGVRLSSCTILLSRKQSHWSCALPVISCVTSRRPCYLTGSQARALGRVCLSPEGLQFRPSHPFLGPFGEERTALQPVLMWGEARVTLDGRARPTGREAPLSSGGGSCTWGTGASRATRNRGRLLPAGRARRALEPLWDTNWPAANDTLPVSPWGRLGPPVQMGVIPLLVSLPQRPRRASAPPPRLSSLPAGWSSPWGSPLALCWPPA